MKNGPLDGPRRSTFVVRVDRDDHGNVRGVIERVRTGEKEWFRGLEAIGAVIARMMEAERRSARDPPGGGVRGPPRSRPPSDREADA
jgi:hypothetical protein